MFQVSGENTRKLRQMVVDEMCRQALNQKHELVASEIQAIEQSEKALDYATEVYDVLNYLQECDGVDRNHLQNELQKRFLNDITMLVVMKWFRAYITDHPKEFTSQYLRFVIKIVSCFPYTTRDMYACRIVLIEFLNHEENKRLDRFSEIAVQVVVLATFVILAIVLYVCK